MALRGALDSLEWRKEGLVGVGHQNIIFICAINSRHETEK